jgi:hypothetical protein
MIKYLNLKNGLFKIIKDITNSRKQLQKINNNSKNAIFNCFSNDYKNKQFIK